MSDLKKRQSLYLARVEQEAVRVSLRRRKVRSMRINYILRVEAGAFIQLKKDIYTFMYSVHCI